MFGHDIMSCMYITNCMHVIWLRWSGELGDQNENEKS